LRNATILPPCFVGEGAVIENSVIGPHVSVGERTTVTDSRIVNSIIQKDAVIRDAQLRNSMVGNFVTFTGQTDDVSLGDYSTVH
jgi:glucose-1-phosphate thymidylyltransferase